MKPRSEGGIGKSWDDVYDWEAMIENIYTPVGPLDSYVFQVERQPTYHRVRVLSFVQVEHCSAYEQLCPWLYEQKMGSNHQTLHFASAVVPLQSELLEDGDTMS